MNIREYLSGCFVVSKNPFHRPGDSPDMSYRLTANLISPDGRLSHTVLIAHATREELEAYVVAIGEAPKRAAKAAAKKLAREAAAKARLQKQNTMPAGLASVVSTVLAANTRQPLARGGVI